MLAYAHAVHTYTDRAHGDAQHSFPAHVVKEQDDEIARMVAKAHPDKVFLIDEAERGTFECPACGYPNVTTETTATVIPKPEHTTAMATPRMAPGRRQTKKAAQHRSRIARMNG
mgnify:CR=1 FL=1